MLDFFVLTIGSFNQYKYAFFEVCDNPIYSPAHRCLKCGGQIGMMKWQPPFCVNIQQPKRVGDFVAGAGGSCFLSSPKFIDICSHNNIRGIERYFPVTIAKMGTTSNKRMYPSPVLFGVDIVHNNARVLYDEMGTVWDKKPGIDFCKFCGPGGGGKNGIWKSIDRIIIDEAGFTEDDIFSPINFSGIIIISTKLAELIQKNELSNITLTPCSRYQYSFGNKI